MNTPYAKRAVDGSKVRWNMSDAIVMVVQHVNIILDTTVTTMLPLKNIPQAKPKP
jgi:hypothetical protein